MCVCWFIVGAKERGPRSAEAVLQIQIVGGLWCDCWPKVRHLVIYLLHYPPSFPLYDTASTRWAPVHSTGFKVPPQTSTAFTLMFYHNVYILHISQNALYCDRWLICFIVYIFCSPSHIFYSRTYTHTRLVFAPSPTAVWSWGWLMRKYLLSWVDSMPRGKPAESAQQLHLSGVCACSVLCS